MKIKREISFSFVLEPDNKCKIIITEHYNHQRNKTFLAITFVE